MLLCEDSPLLDVIQELDSGLFLKHEVKLVRLFKIIHKLDDALLTLILMEEVNFIEVCFS